ncbi:suppressor protein SRP40-like [Homalodisca vitripennis]|uniref:suppressor protein SRP40-like n=1 Tax=Homalodisca vitripennis TaxID=197043 RepID=UPI001EEA6CD9|nr:suppressor protein SRP40-like [Homalodisca vitripennis]
MNSKDEIEMRELNPPILFVSMPSPLVSPSSSSSSSSELRGIRLFRAASRRVARKKPKFEDDFTDYGPSTTSSSDGQSDSGSGKTSPDNDSRSKNTDSTLRKVFKALKLSSQKSADRRSSDTKSDSSSSSSSSNSKKKSTNGNTKKILRQPTTYTYVKGTSGLPIPRPRSANSSPPACGQCYVTGY